MKNLKISETVHDELKVYSAKRKFNMSQVGDIAIVKYLKGVSHDFIHPKLKSSTKK